MPYCQQCGAETREGDAFCSYCGLSLGSEPGPVGGGTPGPLPSAGTRATQMDVIITPLRIVVMSILSFGLYLPYWLYVTWKHYRDHTGQEAYPVWHALTQFVPIYGFFRIHAHVRTYRELMTNTGLATSLSAGWAVVIVLISYVVGAISSTANVTPETAGLMAAISLVSFGITAGLILHIQGNLNSYWVHVRDRTSGIVRITSARIGVGEVILAFLGIMAWIGTLGLLLG